MREFVLFGRAWWTSYLTSSTSESTTYNMSLNSAWWKKFKLTFPKILLTISLYASPTTELSLTADLQSSTLAEWMGTYLSWEDPASRTLLNRWRLEFSDSLYMNVCLMSEWSFKANCWSDPDFFHLCITHMPALTGNKEMCKTISAYSTAAKIFT